jgi:amino acid adenylation domain-containing protein
MSAPTPNPVYPTQVSPPRDLDRHHHACVHELLEAVAQEHANSIAVEFEGRSLTYAEVHARANQLARVLRRQGVQREGLVGVCMERSLEMEIALLGILKAGGAYLPLDVSFGAGRIQYVLEESGAKVLITQKSLLNLMPRTQAEILCLDPSWDLIRDESDEPVPSEVGPSNLAYVIYTSGSTGKPKGVQIEHRNLANLLCSMHAEPGIGPGDILLSITTISFDLSVPDIFLPLLAGARLVIASREATFDGKLLRSLLASSKATFMQATPTTWQLLLEAGWTGDRKLKAIVGGEAVSAELARKLAASCGSVWNMYGPTETTVWSSGYRVEGRDERNVSIGKAIANTSLYVLGPDREPLPHGTEGELYIGGDGLARGYFNPHALERACTALGTWRGFDRMAISSTWAASIIKSKSEAFVSSWVKLKLCWSSIPPSRKLWPPRAMMTSEANTWWATSFPSPARHFRSPSFASICANSYRNTWFRPPWLHCTNFR